MSTTAAGDRSVAIGGDVVDSIIVTGDHATVKVVVGDEDGARLERLGLLSRPRRRRRVPPLGAPPPPWPGHLDREDAIAAVDAVRGALNLHGERGIGKTWALAEALGHAEGGVVFVDAKGLGVDDLLQDLFRAFWDCDPPAVPVGTQLRDALAKVSALVVIDGLTADEDDAQRLVAAAPQCRFVIASRERVLWSADAHAVAGLAPADALRVVEQELGRELRGDERERAERLRAQVRGNPLRIRQEVAAWGREGAGEGQPPGGFAGGGEGAAPSAPGGLDEDERRVVSALALFGEAAVGVERLAEITGVADVGAVLERLRARHVVAAHSPRYSLLVDVPAAEDPATLDRALAALTRAPEEGPVLPLLRRAVDAGRDAEAVALARAASPLLGASGHWERWDATLETALHAARRAGDAEGEGWALHQLGTLAFCLGRTAAAADLLERALKVRDAKVTRHNLKMVRGGGGGLPPQAAVGAIVVVVAVGGGALAIAVGGGGDDPDPPMAAITTKTRTTPPLTDPGDTGTTPGKRSILRMRCPPDVRGSDDKDRPFLATVTGTLRPRRAAVIGVTLTDERGGTYTDTVASDADTGDWAAQIAFSGGASTARARLADETGVEASCEFRWPPQIEQEEEEDEEPITTTTEPPPPLLEPPP